MNTQIRDLQRRHYARMSGKQRFFAAREAGLSRAEAATIAGISLDYAANLYSQSLEEAVAALTKSNDDEAYVGKLIELGGLPRLSERLGRLGHTVCLPLVPFGGRP